MYFYGIVAAANFASTYCQYDALRFVGFTTQALAKCAKMVPVLIIGRLVYKKSYKEKEYVSARWLLRTSNGPRDSVLTCSRLLGRWCSRSARMLHLSHIRQCASEIIEITPCNYISFRQPFSSIDRMHAFVSVSRLRWLDKHHSRALLWQIEEGHFTSYSLWACVGSNGLRECLRHAHQRPHLRGQLGHYERQFVVGLERAYFVV